MGLASAKRLGLAHLISCSTGVAIHSMEPTIQSLHTAPNHTLVAMAQTSSLPTITQLKVKVKELKIITVEQNQPLELI